MHKFRFFGANIRNLQQIVSIFELYQYHSIYCCKGSDFFGRYTAVFGEYIVTHRAQRDKNSSPTISLRPIINGGTE